MESVSEYFEPVDEARAWTAEKAVTIERVDAPFAHGRKRRPRVQLPEDFRLARRPLGTKPARHQRDNGWLRSPHRLPGQLPRRLARGDQRAVVAARNADHFRDPMPSRHRRVQPLQAANARSDRKRTRLNSRHVATPY